MASWTDTPVNFTPYIAENPIEAMLSVGLTKQQQFGEGVQKVQSYVDTINGLDISKKEIKDYVQNKLNSLHQSVNNVSGDFSDQRLTNQIGGAASKIANDPIVQNGILASNAIRSGYQQMETSRKEGKSNAANELFFTDAVNNWQNDGQFDTKLNASYTPYFDIVGKVRAIYKDQNAGQDLPPGFSERMITKDANGNEVFNINYAGSMVLMEGVSTKRVQDAIDLVMSDASAQQQLQIEGYARFRGMDDNGLFNHIVNSTQSQLKTYNDAIAAAQSKLGGSTAGNKAAIQNEITQLKSIADGLAANSKSLVEGLAKNPEAVKARIVQQEMNTNLLGTLAYQKMVESPLWNQNIELEKFRQIQNEFIYRQENDARNFKLETFKAETAAAKAAEEDKEKEGINQIGNLPLSEQQGALGQKSYYDTKQDLFIRAKDLSIEASNEYASATQQIKPFRRNPSTNEWEPNVGEGLYANAAEASKKMMDLTMDMKSRRTKGTLPPELAPAMTREEKAWDDHKTVENRIRSIESEIQPQLQAIKESVGTKRDGSEYPSDWFDAYSVDKDLPGANAAQERLTKKYGNAWRSKMGINLPISGGMSGTSTPAPNYGDYVEFTKKLKKNENLIGTKQQVEDKFKASQFAFENKATILDRSKPELHNQVIQGFTAALLDQAQTSPKGDAADILEWTKASEDEQKNNQYMAWAEYNNGKKTWWVGASRGAEFKKVEVRQDVFQQNTVLQKAIPNTEFQDMFRVRLAASGGKNTYSTPGDVKINGGQVSAIAVPTAGGDYNVQVHLEEPEGMTMQYRMKLYITDKKSGTPIVQGVSFPPADMVEPGTTPALTTEQVMDQIKKRLSNPDYIKDYIDKYYKQ